MDLHNHKIALGTVQFGLNYGVSNTQGKTDINEVSEILNFAKKLGINTLDTAYAYGNSEQVIGNNTISNDYKIITKYSGNKEVHKEFRESTRRLQRKTIYGYLFHNFKTYLNSKKSFDEMMNLKREGLIQKVGFSLYSVDDLITLLYSEIEFDLIQIPINIFNQKFIPYLQILKKRGIEIHGRSIFSQGLIFMKEENIPSFFYPVKERIVDFYQTAISNATSTSLLAMYFILKNGFVDKLVIGVNSLNQLKENMEELNKIDLKTLNHIDFEKFSINDDKYINPSKWILK